MIEIHFLEKLDAFARCGTLSAAAEELYISQPALTKSMGKLEEIIGVRLFERTGNRLELTETGRYAAKLASEMLKENDSYASRVVAFDRSLRTISFASCAPAPAYELTPLLQQLYAGMTIQTEVCTEKTLTAGLKAGTYQLIVTHIRPSDDDLYFVPCGHERLSLAVPEQHPLAERKSISFAEMDNMPILQIRNVGFWNELVQEKIPHPHILTQDAESVFYEIREASALPTFHSDYYDKTQPAASIHRKIIPVSDTEASASYYLVCRQEIKAHFQTLFNHLPAWCRQ